MSPILQEIIVFSIALTLPTYFVRVIDEVPGVFKRTVSKIKRWWWERHCFHCGRPFKWQYNQERTAVCSVCSDCAAQPHSHQRDYKRDEGLQRPPCHRDTLTRYERP